MRLTPCNGCSSSYNPAGEITSKTSNNDAAYTLSTLILKVTH
jgi:hypothetical protein